MGNAQWRNTGEDFEWTTAYSDKLLKKVAGIKPANVDYKPVIMLFGPTGHGKSCFINSISSVNKGRKSNLTNTAGLDVLVTTMFRRYEIKDGKLNNVVLADVHGTVERDENAFLVQDVLKIVEGHVKPNYAFTKTTVVSEGDDFYNSNPKEYEKVHCVIFVFDCRYVEDLHRTYNASIVTLMKELNAKDIPSITILTHADMVCTSGIQNIFRSKAIKAKLDYLTEYLGIPFENIHPVHNFGATSEGTTNLNKLLSIPLLFALQQALYFACDTIEKKTHN